jgi:type I restriction-modification system DNA methylase subunit
MLTEQISLPLGALRNRALFSGHWLENRLALEPEWAELRNEARGVLDGLSELWRVQRGRVEHYGDEQGLEQAFIQPVLERLGWKLKYQTYLQGRKPDYALFVSDEALDAALASGRNSPDFWKYPTLVADAKAWHISLDRPNTVNNKREYPPEQIESYLNLSRLDFGVLTNGKLWRLVPREYNLQQRRFQTYLELDLQQLLESWSSAPSLAEQFALFDEFFRFYLFFSPVAFREVEGRKTLLQRAVEGSSEYRLGVGEGLKDRAFEALRLCIEGLLARPENELDPVRDLELCREQSFILLYRLLFIMYAEDRRLLPYKLNRTYTNNRSLGRRRDEIAGTLDRALEGRGADYARDSTAIWSDLLDLFDLVDRGHRTYGVPAYNGGLFDAEEHSFLASKQIADFHMARVIDQLGRASDPHKPAAGLFRVDYYDLAIQHLGGIYEGLLELHPHYATEQMVVVKKRGQGKTEERVQTALQPVPRGFQATGIVYQPDSVYLLTNKGERRASGSYYTPDHIVEYIVEKTLGPLCADIIRQLQSEIDVAEAQAEAASGGERAEAEERVEKLRRDFDDRVLNLRVLDPAMGSGHFLIRACQYLAEEIATHPYTGDERLTEAPSDESALGFWKRRVVERCLYGVDMNEMAVELAKLALWLETVSADQPLSFLDHHLRHGNSLVGARLSTMGVLPGEIVLLRNNFANQAEAQLPVLLEPLAAIRQAPSDTAGQVKDKQRLHVKFERAREPFRQVGDLWSATFTREGGRLVTAEAYQQAIAALAKPKEFNRISEEDWFRQAVAIARRGDMECFHWELEFPEAFFDDDGRRVNAGFDAVIGNPPYDVLSEAETGHDISAFKSFIAHDPVYEPSRRGKNNLYKLFICRALELLCDGGLMGYITPMAVLGDDQAADIRRRIVEVGAFTGIEAFPQKDNPARRVFSEAKLSTAVFTLLKGSVGETGGPEFVARVHPGRMIESNSPSLKLSTASIPLYDPANFTIVSCSQDDWDLATRIMQSGRMTRLKEFTEFFQGEVNETNERAKGTLTLNPDDGKLVTRGASVCLYILRDASQGNDLFLRVDKFLDGKGEHTKAFHHQYPRVGLQESSPQNNFRRVISAFIPAGQFCNHKINYLPEHTSQHPLRFVLSLLNSKLIDWYFRLGSTNAAVSHYQLYNLPCPIFADMLETSDETLQERALDALASGNTERVLDLLQPSMKDAPFSPAVRTVIIEAANRIIAIEERRGDISRAARSALAPEAQPYQDLIDRIFYAMAGLSASEAAGLEERLAQML